MAKTKTRSKRLEDTFDDAVRFAARSYVKKETCGFNLSETQENELRDECESWLRTFFGNYELKIPEDS